MIPLISFVARDLQSWGSWNSKGFVVGSCLNWIYLYGNCSVREDGYMCLGLFAQAMGAGSGEWKVVRFSHFQNHDFVGHYLLNSCIGISCMVADSRSLVASQNMEEYCTEVKAVEA